MQFNDVRIRYGVLGDEIDAAVRRVLASGEYIFGPSVQRFEQEFACFCGKTEGVAVASGTDALSIALRALGIKHGDEVMVPAVSASATAMAVALAGAKPVFVDVSTDDFNLNPDQAAGKRTSRTKAIVAVHLYGMPARLEEIARLGLPVLEDAAQAHGSEATWGRCGSYGPASAFSFYPTKNLGAFGDGGMVVTSDTRIAEKARLLRNYGQRGNCQSETLGQNSRLDELHAAVLRIQLPRLAVWNQRRRDIALRYRKAFEDLPLRMQAETGSSNYHLFVVTTPQRDKLQAHLSSLGIPTLIHYPAPLPRQRAFAEFDPAPCPNADLVCSQILSLPMHAFLSDQEAEQVIDGVRGFFTG